MASKKDVPPGTVFSDRRVNKSAALKSAGQVGNKVIALSMLNAGCTTMFCSRSANLTTPLRIFGISPLLRPMNGVGPCGFTLSRLSASIGCFRQCIFDKRHFGVALASPDHPAQRSGVSIASLAAIQPLLTLVRPLSSVAEAALRWLLLEGLASAFVTVAIPSADQPASAIGRRCPARPITACRPGDSEPLCGRCSA